MKQEKIFALTRELKELLARTEPLAKRERLLRYLNEHDFKGCADYIKKNDFPGGYYFLELMGRGDEYKWSFKAATFDSAKFENLVDKIGIFESSPSLKNIFRLSLNKGEEKDLKDLVFDALDVRKAKFEYKVAGKLIILGSIYVDREFKNLMGIHISYGISKGDQYKFVWCIETKFTKGEHPPELPIQDLQNFCAELEKLIKNKK